MPTFRKNRAARKVQGVVPFIHIGLLGYVWILLGLLLTGCNFQLPLGEKPLITRIEAAERLWEAQQIRDYRIKIESSNSAASYSFELIVQSGIIVEAGNTCLYHEGYGRDCPPLEDFSPINFTIPALFESLRAKAGTEAEQWIQVEFDEQYGFPRMYSYYEEGTLDGGGGYEVVEFVPN